MAWSLLGSIRFMTNSSSFASKTYAKLSMGLAWPASHEFVRGGIGADLLPEEFVGSGELGAEALVDESTTRKRGTCSSSVRPVPTSLGPPSKNALAAHFEAMREVSEPIPEPHSSVDYVEVVA